VCRYYMCILFCRLFAAVVAKGCNCASVYYIYIYYIIRVPGDDVFPYDSLDKKGTRR